MDINLNVPINGLGYGVVGYNIYNSLLQQKHNVTLWPIGNITLPTLKHDRYGDIIPLIKNDIKKQDLFNPNLPCLKIWHENHLAERIGKGQFIAYPFFEISKLDDRRKSHLMSTDNIIVASNWAKSILSDNGITKPIQVAPCGVDRSLFNESLNQINTKQCIFFNCGKWEIRKGHDILILAFKEAFKDDENVALWMMPHNPFINEEDKYKWHRHYDDRRVTIIDRVQDQLELAEIMGKTFCGVFPSRAEGWNLELLEMMSCGKHVIATNYSAHTEFCTKENCYLIEIDEEEPMYDGKWFFQKDGVWASIKENAFDQLVHGFRDMYHIWENQPDLLNHEGIETAKRFSWDNCVNNILGVIE